jgi:hypothetical protein
MSMREREGLLARVRHLRRVAAAADSAADAAVVDQPPAARSGLGDVEVGGLEARVAHLEQLVEGLQDSVHREFLRHSKLIGELEARVQPAALSAALDEDVRNRGL